MITPRLCSSPRHQTSARCLSPTRLFARILCSHIATQLTTTGTRLDLADSQLPILQNRHASDKMADTNENGSPLQGGEANQPQAAVEHLNIKVTDNNNEVFFKIKRNTKLEKLMTAFCDRQGKTLQSVRFLFEGQRVQPADTPDTVCGHHTLRYQADWGPQASAASLYRLIDLAPHTPSLRNMLMDSRPQLEMQDGDTLEVHQEQVGGC